MVVASLLWRTSSRHLDFSSCGSQALDHELSSCGAWTQMPCGKWGLLRPGIELVSLAFQGGFLTTDYQGSL